MCNAPPNAGDGVGLAMDDCRDWATFFFLRIHLNQSSIAERLLPFSHNKSVMHSEVPLGPLYPLFFMLQLFAAAASAGCCWLRLLLHGCCWLRLLLYGSWLRLLLYGCCWLRLLYGSWLRLLLHVCCRLWLLHGSWLRLLRLFHVYGARIPRR